MAVQFPTKTVITPEEAPVGTVAVICPSLTIVKLPAPTDKPLNNTSVAPVNPTPLIVTIVPSDPLVGVNDEIANGIAANVTSMV